MYKLKYYNKILNILEDNSLDDYHIRIVYYKCLSHSSIIKDIPVFTPSYEPLASTNILSIKSLEIFWESFTKRDVSRKELLIKSYKYDTKNIESLYFLFTEEMCSDNEFCSLLEMNNQKQILFDIFINFQNSENFFHPVYAYLCSKRFFIEKNTEKLFNVSHNTYRLYETCVYSYLSLSLYFLLIEDYEESKKVLLKCLEFDKNTGQIYLYLGICYSRLRECEKSLSCFNISNKKMICTWKTFYYLAFEYQKITNFDKSRFYYIEGLNVERNLIIQEGYVSLLIFLEDYKEALSYIASSKKSNNILLLKCYCHLFLGNIDESKKSLEKCEKDFKYFCTKGYIEHLTNNIDKACDLYNKSLLLNKNTVVEELMVSATKRNKENEVYTLCTEIFEYIFITTQDISVI